jgi:hypothetical protein
MRRVVATDENRMNTDKTNSDAGRSRLFLICVNLYSSDFDELPSGLSLRVEDSRVVAKPLLPLLAARRYA